MSDSQAAKDHDEQKSKENKYQSRTRSPLKRCWHGDKCKKPNCKFWHPKGRATGAPGRNVRVKRKPKRKPRALNDDNTSEQTASEEDENATHDDEDLISQDAADNDGTCGETTKQIEVKQSCPAGSSCMDFLCPFCDPFRPADCKSGAKCLNIDCPDAHPLGWKVCDKGVTCCDFSCEALHPAGRTEKCPKGDSCWNSSCEFLHPDHWAPREIKTGIQLKTKEQRELDQEKAGLPMLKCKDEFIMRLQCELVLIVTAETGSGKTTQLSQYAADAFEGLIVCTQPRAIAAVSIAQRIASEYDGTSVGHSVGYRVGGRKVNGNRIMIVTDAALIQMAQKDRMLNRVSVLIIDEAHERSLNTDIVVGIAKKVLRNRPNRDFRVVISSATIDPKPFLEFFFPDKHDQDRHFPLDVKGRVFPVTMEVRPVSDDVEDINSILSEEVAKTLREHKLGHCLVFLHGSKEVDRAVANFKKIAKQNWIVLPLYGGLPPEEQNRVLSFNDQNGALRMIVFCTNVAETSLTVPNVRLVIDTGLAKEARYDCQRRMTLLDEVYISQSSADQRKGRAGRTAEGHCVRLFPENKITRKNITPEILRSSLDLVMLQLCALDYNPLDFEYIERPDDTLMRSSIKVLTTLGCLTDQMSVTARGRTFLKLPFDPRMSNFVLTAHETYNQGTVAAEIAAILSAPGSVIYFGGQRKRQLPLLKDASTSHSDLLYHRVLYNSWLNAGKVVNSRCQQCSKNVPVSVSLKDGGCRGCRIKYSNDNGLNNKILDIVRTTTSQVQKLIADKKTSPNGAVCGSSGIESKETIGKCLVQSFPEHIGELLIPTNPSVGVHLISSNQRGSLSFSSALTLSSLDCRFLISMSVTKLPSGRLILNQSHYVDFEWLPDGVQADLLNKSLDMIECFRRTNVNGRYCTHCFKHFREISEDATGEIQFVECLYDASSTTMSVYAPRSISNMVTDSCNNIVNNLMKEDLEYEMEVDCCDGTLEMLVTAGMNIKKMNVIGRRCSVRIADPPVKSNEALQKWICHEISAQPSEIKRCTLYPSASGKPQYAVIIFRNETVAKQCRHLGIQSGSTVSNFGFGGYEVIVWTNRSEPIVNLIHGPKPSDVFEKMSLSIRYEIRLMNVPKTLRHPTLLKVIRTADDCKTSDDQQYNTQNHLLIYKDEDLRNQGFEQLHDVLSQIEFVGDQRRPFIRTKETCLSAQFVLTFRNSEDADKCYNSNQYNKPIIYKVDGNGRMRVKHYKYYRLDAHLKAISEVHGIQFKPPYTLKNDINTQEVIFFRGLPSKCAKAVQVLKTLIAPVKYAFKGHDKQIMAAELRNSKQIRTWAKELKVYVEETMVSDKLSSITIYGEKYEQGQFMAKLTDYYSSFLCRYQLISLPLSACCLFYKGGVGEILLREHCQKNKNSKWTMTFLKYQNAIEVLVKANVTSSAEQKSLVKQCKEAIDAILKSINQRRSEKTCCTYCKSKPGCPFLICGHNYCKQCLEKVTNMMISRIPRTGLSKAEAEKIELELRKNLQCPSCKTPISIKDIASCLNKSSLEEACTAFTILYIRKMDKEHHLAFCPVPNCRGFIERKEGYSSCIFCNNDVCPLCEVTNDERHRNRTCAEYKKLLKLSCVLLEDLFTKAEKFARDHWVYERAQLGDIVDVYRNPGLLNGCLSLQRYSKGIRELGLIELENHTVFCWHGTSREGLVAVCDEGFDPNRRSGQVHGRGEYFGLSASTSVGYNRGSNSLIIAQIITSPRHFKTVPNFCYVVDNPVDWTYSLCLPVLVITYGQKKLPPISWILKAKHPLPPPFYEELPGAKYEGDEDDDYIDQFSKSIRSSSVASPSYSSVYSMTFPQSTSASSSTRTAYSTSNSSSNFQNTSTSFSSSSRKSTAKESSCCIL